ncbi:PREDICTED: GATA zinc finger domain-containing protein 15 [Bactrocera latifrons]|uniref:GATA zinc finger domain-containing protein 15 n=1 Tax=Bactrocera latifrons TaxID=174628 RepID=UPI0008DE5121|nr:PREDICTED: GATA zinc finger domain-containing protein 15 [Bactrocera latifrons]
MIDTKILQFLALIAFIVACSEAHYPYGRQYYNNHHGGYNTQNGNFNNYNNNNNNGYNNNVNSNYNNINNNNNLNSNYNPNNLQNNNNNNQNNNNNRRNAHNNNPLLAINLPKIYLGDFEYMPTPDGYRYSYQLADGTRRTEVGQIPNIAPNSGIYMSDERATAERTALRMRARANSKNRKLSPKSLQSLAG